jgi:M6 family metalloprotease-like protein
MKKVSTLIVGALCCAFTASAIPAKRDVMTVTQPDGTILKIRKVGDERMHFTLAGDNNLVVKGDDGAYYFAKVNTSGILENTGVLATMSETTVGDKMTPSTVDAVRKARKTAVQRKAAVNRTIAQNGMGCFTGDFPRSGNIKGLVIIVQFKDKKFTVSNPQTYYNNMLNQAGFSQDNGTGSARDYFLDSSMNKFVPTFDVYGPVTLTKNYSYYGKNDANGNDTNPEQMIVDACKALDSSINFADYDLDKDGYVDNVYVFYAGEGEAASDDENTIWPHSYELSSANMSFKLDGVTISRYACSNELTDSTPDGIGTFVHEFSHVMGLPDLYDTDYNEAYFLTPGSWSCLDYGPYNNDGRTPPRYGAYERNAMGWIEPTVLSEPASVTLNDIGTTAEAYMVLTSKSSEFFLFENRQLTGWDKYLPNHGMLIWHIDFDQSVWDANTVNNSASKQYVDIVEANDGVNTKIQKDYTKYGNNITDEQYEAILERYETAMTGYCWPGTTGKTSFTSTTTPAFKTFAGKAMDTPVTNIVEKNGVITFDFMGGASAIQAPVATTTEVGKDYFVFSWPAVENATDYLVTIKTFTEGGEAVEDSNDMGSSSSLSLPTGWTSTSTGTYTTNGNYGESSPSLKLSSNGQYLTSPSYNADVNGISFWAKGQSGQGGFSSTLDVQGLVDGKWVSIYSFTPATAGETVTLSSEIPSGVRQVKFLFSKSVGNVALDDVVINSGGGSTAVVLDNYNSVSTGGATTFRADKLLDGVTQYSYTVVATNGTDKSRASSAVNVTLGDSGVGNISVDANNAPATYYNLNGMSVDSNNLVPGLYIKVEGKNVSKVLVK